MEKDTIELAGLRLSTRLGVPDEERRQWQTLELDLELEPTGGIRCKNDSLAETIDYADVAEACRDVAAARPRKLLETLAEELAADVLDRFPAERITLRLKKYIVAGSDHVAVKLSRSERPPTPAEEHET